MTKLTRADLWSLEEYSEKRSEFRQRVMAHKKNRQLAMNDHCRLYFEDEMTIRYQIQEMLRIECVFEKEGIQDELDAYNPLIPDGHNWKATLMVEYVNPNERKEALASLVGIEDKIILQVEGFEPATIIADEDLERETEEKTSSVHFLRFELSPQMIAALKGGAQLMAGIDHPNMMVQPFVVPNNIRDSLVSDLD